MKRKALWSEMTEEEFDIERKRIRKIITKHFKIEKGKEKT